ncbi:hypothetical protein D9611_004452 [Ephemerocybe angulata]|uniref:Nudix hydrolase domain-containing protein n=1 Tax=Ephemerocybe angulata TaxID=980116 RepID=A0A8H5BJL0_9AGAR|nr:hypothetical protein D9611_004452 [Tulosesus angulatus]
MAHSQKITASQELSTSDARWITLKKLLYTDPEGKERAWEMAERKTRSSSGIDAVAIFALLRSRKGTFPPSTVVIEQYRPPIDKVVIGLIDEGETPETTAVRELEEETGYKADRVLDVSPIIVSDPGAELSTGMTNANMKLVTVSVWFDDEIQKPEPKLEPGEHIETRVVPLTELHEKLKDYDSKVWICSALRHSNALTKAQGFIVDARLQHFAAGYQFSQKLKDGELP